MTCFIFDKFIFAKLALFCESQAIKYQSANLLLRRRYSYLWLRLRYFRSAKSKEYLLLHSTYSYLCTLSKYEQTMKTSVIVRFVVLGLLWLGLVGYLVTHVKMTLYIAFVIVASAIIVFVPMYKKYIRKWWRKKARLFLNR